jgi:hypothetical protein
LQALLVAGFRQGWVGGAVGKVVSNREDRIVGLLDQRREVAQACHEAACHEAQRWGPSRP